MAQIIVLSSEPTDPSNISVIQGDMSLTQAESMCLAAARYFREQAMEAEIVRRLSARIEDSRKKKEDENND